MLIGQGKLSDDLGRIMESKDIRSRPDRQFSDRITETEVGKNMHRIGAQLDASADYQNFFGHEPKPLTVRRSIRFSLFVAAWCQQKTELSRFKIFPQVLLLLRANSITPGSRRELDGD